MSRIIVKNLPKHIKEDRLKKLFSEKGEVTNCDLKKTPDGKLRGFAFIGYKTDKEAEKAIKYFNKTFIDTSCIKVEHCLKLDNKYRPRPWSKYSKGSSAYEKSNIGNSEKSGGDKLNYLKKQGSVLSSELEELENDPEFKEFLSLHENRSTKQTWKDDVEKSDYNFKSESINANINIASDNKSEQSEKETVIADTTSHSNKYGLLTQTGRLFVRNLYYNCQESDLENLFKPFGSLTEVHLPIDFEKKTCLGYAFVTFLFPEHAINALNKLDGSDFQGRILHILQSNEKKEMVIPRNLNYKEDKLLQQKLKSGNSYNWNTLFISSNAVAEVLGKKYDVDKSSVLQNNGKDSLGIRLALGETEIVAETKEFLIKNGIKLDVFGQPTEKFSDNVLLVKNLSVNHKKTDVKKMFERFGEVDKVLLPPYGLTAIVKFKLASDCKKAFHAIAYKKVNDIPVYLERAPIGTFEESIQDSEEFNDVEIDNTSQDNILKPGNDNKEEINSLNFADKTYETNNKESQGISTVFVKNLNFNTTEEKLKAFFCNIGPVISCTLATKKDFKDSSKSLSLGYGFVKFIHVNDAETAVKSLQGRKLEGHSLELELSKKESSRQETVRKEQTLNAITGKILVRNIPFEATQKEIKELFSAFGELKYTRLPKKVSGGHRGFAFIEYLSKKDSEKAFEALATSTHIFSRRLVLEWAKETESLDDMRKRVFDDTSKESAKKKRISKKKFLDDLI